ncbi:MAG TPA: PilZ domain-containing protein [Afipia sp.]
MMVERRAEGRRRVLKGGVIAADGLRIDCTVRNMSSGGAGIDIGNAAWVPRTFRLAITRDDLSVRCRVIWNNGSRVGVAFE